MPGAAHRPYFKSSIVQLEGLFKQALSDLDILRTLDRELSYRSTVRAAKLRSKISDQLTRLSAGQVEEAVDEQSGNGFEEPSAAALTGAPDKARPESPENSRPGQDQPVAEVVIEPADDLGDLPSFSMPKTANEPTAVLAAWIALEALSPQTYRRPDDLVAGDRRCVADLTKGRVPWETRENSRPRKRLYYQIVLGSIPMGRATEDLVKAFGDDEERNDRVREKAAIGAILVDKNGLIVEENGIAVSSFAWALPLALKLNLGCLGAWPTIEAKIITKLEKIIRRVDREGRPVPLDLKTIEEAYRWLVTQFDLPDHLVEPPTFALRVYHYYKARNPPEATLLNSFYLGDLARGITLVNENAAPAGLKRYLGIDWPRKAFDLLNNQVALERAVAPAMTPAARWPSPGGHPLVMLQQAAVNLARSDLTNTEGLIAVNGPPGTGKTTLLRDIVAACVLDRAMAMTAFEDPEKAFTPSGQKMAAGEKAFFHLYALNPSLRGHEVLVASSNNKAVENISKELPTTKAINRTTDELSYFNSISDLVHELREAIDSDDSDAMAIPAETWGLIAAVLGNARNRAAFQQSFWWHDDRGFRIYLKAAKGDSVVRELVDPDTGKIRRRTPAVVHLEKPPSPSEAKAKWSKARTKLLTLKREVDNELKALENIRQLCLRLHDARRELDKTEIDVKTLVSKLPALEVSIAQAQDHVVGTRAKHNQSVADLHRHRKLRPNFFARIFRTRSWQAWSSVNILLIDVELVAGRQLNIAEQASEEAAKALKTFQRAAWLPRDKTWLNFHKAWKRSAARSEADLLTSSFLLSVIRLLISRPHGFLIAYIRSARISSLRP
ncbi:hypothetical protein [Bradyrhizobium paxllaeri]|uniref:hypothetical protein n=1 Tax=Bradyrhizobium paxllaeri TaxID=190148 RepID=UPI000AA32BBD|nr:hypothetical protein [Bradyrhizobium paxllaeri]